MLHVCSLSRLHETVERTGARHLVTLVSAGTQVERPARIAPDNHLFLSFNDIVAPMDGMTPPGEAHVNEFLRFIEAWDGGSPLVIHCWAGISRSTAGAFIATCARNPNRPEDEIAQALRVASPSATPNARLVAIADQLLSRDGRMISAIRSIGRGADAFEGTPFELHLDAER